MKRKNEFDAQKEIDHIVKWIKEYFVDQPHTKAVIGISGGKDSTIAAALLVRALGPDRVIGVMMPQGEQKDIADAKEVCNILGILNYTINIGIACDALYNDITYGCGLVEEDIYNNSTITTNTPARIRMATLYAIAAMHHGRVCNTGNRSELYIGYTTKYGDLAGDFALFKNYTVRQVLAIGDALTEIPHVLIHKAPADGMSGLTDEDNLGFLYAEVDAYIEEGIVPEDMSHFEKIAAAHARNLHKNCINLPAPRLAWEYNDDWRAF